VALSLPVWVWVFTDTREEVRADPVTPLQDTDGDFLPDVVEWACLTNPQNPDTDADGFGDFVEVVQRGNPRRVGMPVPVDHELRIVVTATEGQGGVVETNLHLLFRFMGEPSLLTSFRPWLQMAAFPGVEIPLGSLANGATAIEQHTDPNEGLFVRILVPLASESVLRSVLPCTIGARATIGQRNISTAVPLFDVHGVTATLVQYDDYGYAVQSIGVAPTFQGSSNRVCVVQLTRMGSGPRGTCYLITHAYCDDCNGLSCSLDCPDHVGWIIEVPGTAGGLTGG
jgi:hypothetical protein